VRSDQHSSSLAGRRGEEGRGIDNKLRTDIREGTILSIARGGKRKARRDPFFMGGKRKGLSKAFFFEKRGSENPGKRRRNARQSAGGEGKRAGKEP